MKFRLTKRGRGWFVGGLLCSFLTHAAETNRTTNFQLRNVTTQAAFDIDQELTGATTIIAPSPRSLPRINLEVAEPIDQARAVQLLEEAIKQQAGIPIVHVSTVAEAMAKCLENNACALALHLSDADYPTNSDTSAALTWNFRTIPLQPLIEIYKNLAGPHKSRNECGACLG